MVKASGGYLVAAAVGAAGVYFLLKNDKETTTTNINTAETTKESHPRKKPLRLPAEQGGANGRQGPVRA
jgi:hypothetical protein